MGDLRIDHAVVSGTFSLDGETFDVDNNIWVVGDDDECAVIDAPHSVPAILDVVAGRKVKAILLTHAHDDHCRVAPALREEVVAPIFLHPDDKPLWELTHTDYLWDLDLLDGWELSVGGTTLRTLHTLKGSARLAGAMRLGEMAHRLESAVERVDGESPTAEQIER